jgi:1-acyl-sn-glycerol-3-phosphate acyltransferase
MILTGQIKVERNSHDKSETHTIVHAHLDHGKVVGIFPEGTRSPYEIEMLYAFTGVAQYAMRSNVPVIPVGIKGTYHVMSKYDKRPKFKKIVTIHVGSQVKLDEYNHSKLDKKTYRVITDKIMLEIARLSGKNYSHTGRED